METPAQPQLIDNVNQTLRDDLMATIKSGSRVSIAAASFSIYAFQELREQLKDVDELRFIFTSPSFITEKTDKQRREFYIPRLNRERDLFGSEFEIKLRNELSLKAVAKECADWIRRKVCFKSNRTNENMIGFINVDETNYMPITGFTTVDLGCERGNNAYQFVQRTNAPLSQFYLNLFDQVWNDNEKLQVVTEEVLDNITNAYKENAPEFIYFVTLYNICNEFLEDISEDVLPNEATGFKDSVIWGKLYNFQRDAALAIINKLEKYNGCILADSVGLGKTFTALSVIKYYENRNKSVLVLCPKKLHDNWVTYRSNYKNNPLVADRLRYDILYHTDLSRQSGQSNGLDLEHINWGNYDLVVIDESHNFRNGGKVTTDENDENPRENRYLQLMNKVIRAGVKTKVLMLSATPVNNRFYDLRNQLALAYEGDSFLMDAKLKTTSSLDDIFRQDFLHAYYRRAVFFVTVCKLFGYAVVGVNKVVAVKHRAGLPVQKLFRKQHRAAAAVCNLLICKLYVCHSADVVQQLCFRLFAVLRQEVFKIAVYGKMLLYHSFVGTYDNKYVFYAGVYYFVNYQLQRRSIHHRQHLFRASLCIRQKACAAPCRKYNCFVYFLHCFLLCFIFYSTVTLFARLRGLSGFMPRSTLI